MLARPPVCTHTSNNTVLLNPFALWAKKPFPHIDYSYRAPEPGWGLTLYYDITQDNVEILHSSGSEDRPLFPDETQADVLIYHILIVTKKTVPRRTTSGSKVVVSPYKTWHFTNLLLL